MKKGGKHHRKRLKGSLAEYVKHLRLSWKPRILVLDLLKDGER